MVHSWLRLHKTKEDFMKDPKLLETMKDYKGRDEVPAVGIKP